MPRIELVVVGARVVAIDNDLCVLDSSSSEGDVLKITVRCESPLWAWICHPWANLANLRARKGRPKTTQLTYEAVDGAIYASVREDPDCARDA